MCCFTQGVKRTATEAARAALGAFKKLWAKRSVPLAYWVRLATRPQSGTTPFPLAYLHNSDCAYPMQQHAAMQLPFCAVSSRSAPLSLERVMIACD